MYEFILKELFRTIFKKEFSEAALNEVLGGFGAILVLGNFLNLVLYPLTTFITLFVWVGTFYSTDLYFIESFTTKMVLFVGCPIFVLPILYIISDCCREFKWACVLYYLLITAHDITFTVLYIIEIPKNQIDHENYYDRYRENYFNPTEICPGKKLCKKPASLKQCCIYSRDIKVVNTCICLCVFYCISAVISSLTSLYVILCPIYERCKSLYESSTNNSTNNQEKVLI